MPLFPLDLTPGNLWKHRLATGRIALLGSIAVAALSAAAQTPTITTLSATASAGVAAATIASGDVLTLTAAVTAAGTPIPRGQVNFCDAPACTDIHLLGTAQITPAGTATLRFIPGIGNHSYKAIFLGTPHATPAYAASTSPTSSLAVTGPFPTSTTLTSTGIPGNYSLTATVIGSVNTQTPSLTGSVALADTSMNMFHGGALSLSGTGTTDLAWTTTSLPFAAAGTPLIADLNGDGKLDAIFASPQSLDLNLQVMLGKGDGTLSAAPGSPFSVSTDSNDYILTTQLGDVNGDGKPDLLVALSSGLKVFLGNGDGTFAPASGSPYACYGCSYLQVADFNGDGVLDLFADQDALLLLGNGDGTFRQAANSLGGGEFSRLAFAGDLNNDGIPDLLSITDLAGVFYAYSGEKDVTVVLGNPDGTYTIGQTINAGQEGPLSYAIADFNRDGKLDLAIGDGHRNALTIYLGAGDGTFTPGPGGSIFVENPVTLSAADFNNDGKPDLLVGSFFSYPDLTPLLGKGDGTFTSGPYLSSIGTITSGVAIGDLNGDGLPDIVANAGSPGPEIILTQLTQTATATATAISPLGTGTHGIAATYPGDSTYAASTSAPIPLTAQQIKPAVTITPPTTTAYTAQPTTITVAVTAPTGDPTPTGTVTLTSGAYTSTPAPLNNGAAILTVPPNTLAAGTAPLTVSYSGDTNYIAAAGSASLAIAAPTVTLTAAPLSLKAGAATGNTSAITVTPGGGFIGAVTLTAALTASPANANYPPTFSLSPSTVTLAGAANGAATLTVTTTPFEICGVPVASNRKPWLERATGTALACLVVFWRPRRRDRRLRNLGLLSALFLLSVGLSACSGSNNTKATCNVATPGTTAGAYVITVTGTSGPRTATTTLNLAVQ